MHFVGRDLASLEDAGIQSVALEGHDFICRFQVVPRNVYHHFDSGQLIWSADFADNVQGSHGYRGYRLEDDLFLLDFRKSPNGVPERNLFFLRFQTRVGLLVTAIGGFVIGLLLVFALGLPMFAITEQGGAHRGLTGNERLPKIYMSRSRGALSIGIRPTSV